ncbi:hypothetical protein [Inquilinus sp. OTU3971]|uniref:hypothetical protein n=1 Tax=Inquilinus sp. OTU3971 TaxID=3043855 RepID=UPI00313DB083
MRTFASTPALARSVGGIVTAILSFSALGTVAALWSNPWFVRMTPVGDCEVAFLAASSALAGLYVAVRHPACSAKMAGLGGVINFLGVACPICNKILVAAFGSQLLMSYFDPIRVYVAAVGVIVLAVAIVLEITRTPGVQPSGAPLRIPSGPTHEPSVRG